MATPTAAPRQPIAALISELHGAIGAEHVSTDSATLELLSADFSELRLATAAVVVRPGSTNDVAAILAAARQHGAPVTVRGGGMSYTLGYAPRDPGTILIDMRRMNRIVALNLDSRFITVETGATWADIDAALVGTGLAMRFRGTMSGTRATVGGGLGNNAAGHGPGDITNDLLGLEVVLPDGRLVQTGARAIDPELPGVRHSSPDLTGLFVNDAGVFGVRTRASFRLSRAYPYVAAVSYGFYEPEAVAKAMCEVARLDVATDVMGFGSYHHRVFAAQPKPSAAEGRAMAARVFAQAGGGLHGLARLAALARPRAMASLLRHPLSVMVSCDAFDPATARRHAAQAARVLARHGGRKTTPALAYGLRAQPFVPIARLILGIDGECSIPTNCTVPLERGLEALREMTLFFDRNSAEMQRHGVTHTFLMLTLSGVFGIEPILYWRDAISPLRLEVSDPESRPALAAFEPHLEARAFAIDLRRQLVSEVCDSLRGAHFQLGKYYPVREALASEDCWTVLEDIKRVVDPAGLLNPGGLGIG